MDFDYTCVDRAVTMDFDYIEDEKLRRIANQIWDEASFTLENELWMSTAALGGAALEVALIAVLEQLGDMRTLN